MVDEQRDAIFLFIYLFFIIIFIFQCSQCPMLFQVTSILYVFRTTAKLFPCLVIVVVCVSTQLARLQKTEIIEPRVSSNEFLNLY